MGMALVAGLVWASILNKYWIIYSDTLSIIIIIHAASYRKNKIEKKKEMNWMKKSTQSSKSTNSHNLMYFRCRGKQTQETQGTQGSEEAEKRQRLWRLGWICSEEEEGGPSKGWTKCFQFS